MAGLGVDFIPGLQNSFIEERGVSLLWEKAISCTCRRSDTFAGILNDGSDNRRQPFCPKCGGDGWLYRDAKFITALAVHIRGQRNIIDVGIANPGDMLVSPQFDYSTTNNPYKIGAWDKLTATWSQPLDDGQVIMRGAATTDENKGLNTSLTDQEDRIWYEPESAIWCEDENGTIYKENADFSFGPGRVINWGGNAPNKGVIYTLKYNAYFEWIVFQPSMERVDANRDIGQAVYVRKRHVAMVNSSPLATAEDKLSFRSRVQC